MFLNCPTQYQHVQLNQHVQVNCSVLSKLESKPQTHFNMSKAKEISFHLLSFSWQFYIIE